MFDDLDTISRSCFESFSRLRNAQLLDAHGVYGSVTDVPLTFFNGIATSADPDVPAVLDFYQSRRMPFRWWLTPSTRPLELEVTLKASGLRFAFDAKGMVADMAKVDFDVPLAPGVSLVRVEDARGFDDWLSVLLPTFHRPPGEGAVWRAGYEQFGFGNHDTWAHFVGLLDGKPVATTSVLVAGELVGIYHVATLPEARGRGIGSAVTLAGMQHGHERGAKRAVLQSSEMGFTVYQRCGFADVADLRLYDWRPEY
ncbi:MAG TPA: GNAT family N-acetyltransferase [Thermoanaerobaculia bacterium]|jgi:ribosomal protein S18 acetylase RimI-like enzyme